MEEFDIIGSTLNGIVAYGAMIVNDWTISMEKITGGHRLIARRGSEVQSMDIMDGSNDIPAISDGDNGKILGVVDGKWAIIDPPKSKYELYDGAYEVTASTQMDTTLLTAQKLMDADVTVRKIPYAEVSNDTNGITATIG